MTPLGKEFKIGLFAQIYWDTNLMYIGLCIVVIFNDMKNQLDAI
jgi:hypothetical protein